MSKKNLDTYVGLFLISAATLLLEILQMRVLSIVLFAGLVYMIVTFALLGFGIAGALLAVWPALRQRDYRILLPQLCCGFAISAIFGVLFVGRFPVTTSAILTDPRHLVVLFLYGVLFAAPFFFAGLCIGRVLMERDKKISVLYCVNLAGSGIGCVLYPLSMRLFEGLGAIVFAASLAILGAAFFSRRRGIGRFATLVTVSCVLIILGKGVGEQMLLVEAGNDKELKLFQNRQLYPDAEVEFTHWSPLCRTDIIGATNYAVGLPDGSTVPRKVVTIDGAAMTFMWGALTEAQKEAYRNDYSYMTSFRMLAYVTKEDPDVLLIGVGGGNDVLNAELHNANSITGVDINEGVVKAMKGKYKEFTGGLYTDGPANIMVSEGRNFVRHAKEEFDIIHLHGVDTFAALSSGAYLFSENHLYTTEAFVDYLGRLKSDGVLSITRLSLYPPRETLRLFEVAVSALEGLGAKDPFRHIIILGDPGNGIWATMLCKRTPFTDAEIRQYERLCQRIPYFVYWIPDSGLTKPELRNQKTNFYYMFHQAVQDGRRSEFLREYQYDVTEITDDKPFFYKSFRFRDYLHPTRSARGTGGPLQILGFIVLIALTGEALGGILALIFLPLWKFNKEGLKVKGAARYATYFSCLGIGFILIEITLMQRLSLFLGHPGYSVSVVLFSLLVFSGLGSLVSGRLRLSPTALVKLVVPCLAVAAVVLNFAILPPVVNACLGLTLGIRVMITAILLAPLSFLMGMPFPTGLQIVRENEVVQFIPWAWGVNGAASVVGSVASIILAMGIGFSALTALAAFIYVVGMVALLSGRRVASG